MRKLYTLGLVSVHRLQLSTRGYLRNSIKWAFQKRRIIELWQNIIVRPPTPAAEQGKGAWQRPHIYRTNHAHVPSVVALDSHSKYHLGRESRYILKFKEKYSNNSIQILIQFVTPW